MSGLGAQTTAGPKVVISNTKKVSSTANPVVLGKPNSKTLYAINPNAKIEIQPSTFGSAVNHYASEV